MKHIKIREEIFQHMDAIRAVHEQAFGQPQEANIVDKLRENCDGMILWLNKTMMNHVSGVAKYRDEFNVAT